MKSSLNPFDDRGNAELSASSSVDHQEILGNRESLVFKFQEWMVGSELWKKSISYREPIWIIHLEVKFVLIPCTIYLINSGGMRIIRP